MSEIPNSAEGANQNLHGGLSEQSGQANSNEIGQQQM